MEKVILLGDSPFLKQTEHVLHYVLDRFPVIGINGVIKKCRVTKHIFTDISIIGVTNYYKDTPTISLNIYGDLIQKDNKELIDTFTYEGDLCVKKGDKLAWCGFTHDYALSYLITKGVKEVILLGAADFTDGCHYSNDREFVCSKTLQQKSIDFIRDCYNTYLTIRTCNPNSKAGVPYVPIEELLKV